MNRDSSTNSAIFADLMVERAEIQDKLNAITVQLAELVRIGEEKRVEAERLRSDAAFLYAEICVIDVDIENAKTLLTASQGCQGETP